MTNEEMQKTMEFILEQQATFTVNLDQLGEKVNQLAEAQGRMEATIERIVEVQQRTIDVVAAIADAQQRTEARVAELAEAQARTDERLAQTDERLNVLIGVVERYFSNGRKDNS
jgi:ABC-type transporter Mla subunit MlaD